MAWGYTWAYSQAGSGWAGPEKSPTQKMLAQAKNLSPGPARGGYFLSGRAFLKSSIFLVQAQPS
jgi:hypothetical protein